VGGTPRASRRYAALLILSVVIPLAALVHSAAFSNGFLALDDPEQVVENQSIRAITPDNIRIFFTTPIVGMYSPLASLSYAVDYAMGGLNVSTFHATNLLLHLLSVCFVCLIVLRLTGSHATAAIVTAVFAVHPVNVGLIAPLSARSGVLCSCFYLAAYLAYVAYVQTKQTRQLVLSFVLFVLAALSKAPAVVFPALMLLTDYYLQRPWSRRVVVEKIPFVLVSMAFGVLALAVRPEVVGVHGGVLDYSLIERLATVPYSLVLYVFRLLAPFNLSPLYPYPDRVNGHLPWPVFVAPLIAGLLLLVVARVRGQRRLLLFGGGFILIHLILVLKAVPFGVEFMADRYLYLPTIAFALVVAELLRMARQPIRQAGVVVIAMALVAYSIGSYTRYSDWRDNITIYSRTLERYPNSAAAHNNLASALDAAHRPDEALAHYQKAAMLDPDFATPHINVGVFLVRRRKPDEALAQFTQALTLAPDSAEAHAGAAQALVQLDRASEAIPHLEDAVRLAPSSARNHLNLALVLDHEGRVDDAIAQYTAALALDATLVEAHSNLGAALASQGHIDAAKAQLSEALRLNPNFADAHVTMAIVLLNSGDKAGAIRHLQSALAAVPDHQAARELLDRISK